MADGLQGFVFDGIDAAGVACPSLLRFKGRVRGHRLTVCVEGDVPVDSAGRADWASEGGEAALEKLHRVLARLGGGPVDRDTPGSCRLVVA